VNPRRLLAGAVIAGALAASSTVAATKPPLHATRSGGARHSIELTMYELYDTQVEHALAAAAARGVDVQVLLNGGYYREHESTNSAAYSYLHSHGVEVRYTPTYFALTHQKTLTVDGSESAVMTLNFDGEYATTRDYAIIDSQPVDVEAIVKTFDADWAGRDYSPLNGTSDLVWSPGAALSVVSLINSAHKSIELENEEMDYAPATDALCAAARRGVKVEIVMTYESDWKSALAKLSGCGAQVRLYHGQSYYIHAKLLLVDGAKALVSSQNLSTTSLDYNRELGIEVTNAGIVGQLERDFASDFTGGGTA
jgi:cardiolipin synthase